MPSCSELLCIVERRAEIAAALESARAAGDLARAGQLEYVLARWDALIALVLQDGPLH